ncbi:MAG: bifunctional hydroxymethylpyrimidine kinase/phosphomethylpyrimidine kinase, partial [Opitutales bacterium]|nr:bifunctional hydroxymethylpyrimidine kinase/phosphomethylpyrimidine kinase [Opitutales bacterium]
PRVCGVNTHGSGCTLSAAIAARLALSEDLKTAVENAREYLLDGLKNPLKIAGQAFINHFPKK